jgi:hypothetical protein
MSDIKQQIGKQIDDILESYYHKEIDLLEVRKQFLTLIEENYVSKGRGKCGDCKHFNQYTDYTMKCSFYGSMPRGVNDYELCIVDNGDKYGFESKI